MIRDDKDLIKNVKISSVCASHTHSLNRMRVVAFELVAFIVARNTIRAHRFLNIRSDVLFSSWHIETSQRAAMQTLKSAVNTTSGKVTPKGTLARCVGRIRKSLTKARGSARYF